MTSCASKVFSINVDIVLYCAVLYFIVLYCIRRCKALLVKFMILVVRYLLRFISVYWFATRCEILCKGYYQQVSKNVFNLYALSTYNDVF